MHAKANCGPKLTHVRANRYSQLSSASNRLHLHKHKMGTRCSSTVCGNAHKCPFPYTHFRSHRFPPQTQPLRVWTSNGLDNRRAAGKWNKLNSLAPQPVAAATATQGTYGQLYPQGLGGWESKFDARRQQILRRQITQQDTTHHANPSTQAECCIQSVVTRAYSKLPQLKE